MILISSNRKPHLLETFSYQRGIIDAAPPPVLTVLNSASPITLRRGHLSEGIRSPACIRAGQTQIRISKRSMVSASWASG